MHLPRRRSGFKRRAILIASATAIIAVFLALFGIQSVQRIQAVEDRWRAYSQDAAEASRLLHNITLELGYGGYIHNFKNYILRRNPDYLLDLQQNRIQVYADLDKLAALAVTDEEQAALARLRGVFDRYVSAIDTAAKSFRRGLSAVEVDVLVKVDDRPALEAIAVLNHSILTRARLAENEISKAMSAASSMVWVLLAVVPVVLLLGVMLILFLRRIVDANINLAEVRDELAMLLRQAPDAILHVASNGRILRANDRALALFGYSRATLLQMCVEELIPGRYREAHNTIRDNAFDGMQSRPIGDGTALCALTKDGREVPVDISLNFSMSGGRRIATAIVRDITERKRAETVLQEAHAELENRVRERTTELEQRTRELEDEIAERKRAESQLVQSAKMATIGEMASGITHELNQPMNIMRMGVEAAQIRIERGQADIPSLSETLQRVESQILRMSDIINHMRAYSRMDTDNLMPFDPYQAVREGCKLFQAQLSGANIDLHLDVSDQAEARVLGHATRLEQVMLNLLSNARDAILSHRRDMGDDHRGYIRVHMDSDEEQKTLSICVDDNGGGIDAEVLPHIFAPFVTTKESGQGTGLGLSISYGIIGGMNGQIEAVNQVEGARFRLTLPLVGEERAVAQLADVPTVGKTIEMIRSKILVVDDEETAAHSLADFLQEIGYLVYTAYNGEEALQIFQSDPVDAVITDVRMPVMGGEELIRLLRQEKADLPIFVMTGHGAESEGGGLDGATEIWCKPLSLGEVANRLNAACRPDATPSEARHSGGETEMAER